jgi:hypothetical protein
VDGVYTLCCGAEENERIYEDADPNQWSEERSYERMVPAWDMNAHAETCPARGAYEGFHAIYVDGSKAYIPEAYLTAGGTWTPDSMEDAPDDVRGEVFERGVYHVEFDWQPPRPQPEYQPYYS